MVQASDADGLREVADGAGSEPVGAWARMLEVRARMDERDYAGASAALDTLEADFPGHSLVMQLRSYEPGSGKVTAVEHLRERIDALQAWDGENGRLFRNPTLPDGSPRVRVNTSKGPIVVGLFQERAPKHCDNFKKLCGEGFYDGTKFHRVVEDFMIQTGDPNSRDADVSTWGTGGPGYKVEPETEGNEDLYHFEGVLAAAKMTGDTESSGSQFYITTGAPHHLDGQHTIFGLLLEGQDVVDAIEAGKIVEGTQRPEDPVTIESTEVL